MGTKICKYLLLMLGFSSASCMVAYGTPETEFRVRGRVVDGEGNPIPGIEVSYPQTDGQVQTDDNGRFSTERSMFPAPENMVEELIFSDTDGEENGGEFADRRVFVHMADGRMTQEGNWTTVFTLDMGDVELERKDNGHD